MIHLAHFGSDFEAFAGDFEDAVVGAGGEVHLFHGLFEVAGGFGVEGAVFADLFRAHGGVGGDAVAGCEAEALDVADFAFGVAIVAARVWVSF